MFGWKYDVRRWWFVVWWGQVDGLCSNERRWLDYMFWWAQMDGMCSGERRWLACIPMSADGWICSGERRWLACVPMSADGWNVFWWTQMVGLYSDERRLMNCVLESADGWLAFRWAHMDGMCSGERRWLACLLSNTDGWLVFGGVQIIILCWGEHRWLVCVIVSADGWFFFVWADDWLFFGECWWSADGVVIRWYTQHLFQTIRYGHLNMGIILEYYFHPGLFYMVILHTSLVNHKVLFKKKTERRILPLVKGLWIYILHQVPAVVMWGSNTV